jgi:hypothetical protein
MLRLPRATLIPSAEAGALQAVTRISSPCSRLRNMLAIPTSVPEVSDAKDHLSG